MQMIQVSIEDWDDAIGAFNQKHLLQSSLWAKFKTRYGWGAFPLLWQNENGEIAAGAMVLVREMRLGLRMMYIPRGPIMDWESQALISQVLGDLENFAKKHKAIFIKIDPEIIMGEGIPGEGGSDIAAGLDAEKSLDARGWEKAEEQVQFRNTVWLDLTGGEDAWLERMKQKTRYNIRLAARKGVVVRRGGESDFHTLYRLYAETSVRDGFVIRSEAYYQQVWKDFMDQGWAMPLVAEAEGVVIAALFLFWYGKRAWYLYGMSSQDQREKMPNYLLQWEAMRFAKEMGCEVYDLWGAPDQFDESDPMWGVFRFKEGLGGKVIRTSGAWDYVVRPWMYRVYTKTIPAMLNLMRKLRKADTRKEVAGV